MKTSETLKNLVIALSSFQEQAKSFKKDGAGYGYKYITIDTILDNVRPVLAQNKLAFVQNVGAVYEGGINIPTVQTVLFHESGEYIESDVFHIKPVMIKKDGTEAPITPQVVGSAVTYAKRYQLVAMLGLNADPDDDGKAASGVTDANKQNWGQMISPAQQKKIGEMINEKKMTKDAALALAAKVAGRIVSGSAELTTAEADKLIDELSIMK